MEDSGTSTYAFVGRGYYKFSFANHEDLRAVWALGTVNLKSGVMRLFEWTKDFKAHTQRQTHTQVWIRLWELPQEYWMERTLYEIAGAIRTPLLIDNVTKNRLFGHYAKVLMDLDLSENLFYEVMVEQEGYAFPVEIEYEGLPDFCTYCKSIGHNITSCWWLHPKKSDKEEKVLPINKGKKLNFHSSSPRKDGKQRIIPLALAPLKILRLRYEPLFLPMSAGGARRPWS